MQEPRDSYARLSAHRAHHALKELREDMLALLVRLSVQERKTAGIAKIGRCGLCGEPTKTRYCEQCSPLWEGEAE